MNFLSEQADYIHFITGLAFLLLGGTCVTLAKEDGKRLPWPLLGFFGLLQGLNSWLMLFTDFIGSSLFLSIAHIGLESASFASLIEFGRKGFLKVRGKGPGPWIYLPFGAVLLFEGLTGGVGGFDAFSRHVLGVTACAWGGISLIAAADILETGLRRQMRRAGIAISLLLVPLAVSLGNPTAAGWGHINLDSLAGIPTIWIFIFPAALSACATLALWGYSYSRSGTVQGEKHLPYPIFNKAIPLAIILTLSAGWVFTHFIGIHAWNDLRDNARSFVTNFSTALEGVISDIDQEAKILSGSPAVIALLSGMRGAAISDANSALDRYSKASPGMICYVLDKSGKTVASSNRDRPDSFVGKSYAFRPYFKDAIFGKPAWYFALGVTTGERGYYAGFPVRGKAPDPIGVAVIKKTLADSMFDHPPDSIYMVIDPHGVIFLSGRKEFLFRTLWPLPEETRKNLIAGRQFGPGPFTPIQAHKPANEDKVFIEGKRYSTALADLELGGWSIVYLHPKTEVLIYRLFGMSLTFVICSIIVICHIAIRRLGKSATEVSQSHVLLESSLESTADGILVVDQEGKIEKYNRKFAEMWGGPEEILASWDASKVVSHISGQIKNKDVFLRNIRKLFKDTSEENLSTVEFKDGRIFEYYSIPKQADGRNAGRVWSIRDITERKKAEEAALNSSRRLELLNRIGAEILLEKPLEKVLEETLLEVCRFLDLPRSAVRWEGMENRVIEHCDPGHSPSDEDFHLYRDSLSSGGSLEDGGITVVDDVLQSPRSPEWKAEMSRFRVGAYLGVPLPDPQGSAGAFFLCSEKPRTWTGDEIATAVAVGRAIEIAACHSRVFRSQQELAGRLLSLMNNIPGVVYRGLKDWSLVFIGADVERITGCTPEEFMTGRANWRNLIHADDLKHVKDTFRETVRESKKVLHVEYRTTHRDGTVRQISDRRQLFYNGDGSFAYVDGLLLDITGQKKAEESLRETRDYLENLLDHANAPIIVWDPQFRITRFNRAFERLTGRTAKEVLGSPLDILFPEDRREKAMNLIRRTTVGERWEIVEIQILHVDGSVHTVLWNSATLYSADGKAVVATIAQGQDITERKQAEEEREKLREQLLQSQKMEAIGTLAGGVAHDFNNMLTAIEGYSDLLLSRLGEGNPLAAEVREIRKASDSASSLTRQLLAFSRMQVFQPKVLDMNGLVANMRNMLGRLIGENIELLMLPGENLGRLKADPGQVEQILLNLVVNARDAMPDGGRITIETSNVDLDESFSSKQVSFRPGPYVMLTVTDTGTGMDKETMSRIFEPFFTTKEKGKGTGLGLATVYGIVKQSNGYVWVYSEPGHGTTFKIHLPRVDEQPEEEAPRPQIPAQSSGSETVLVVEDTEMVKNLVREVLGNYGYTVLEASDGNEALALCERRKEPIHLLLTDMMMPGMSGTELARAVSSIRPGIKVLYMSGYTEYGSVENPGLPSGSFFIQKPFSIAGLTRKVREVLES